MRYLFFTLLTLTFFVYSCSHRTKEIKNPEEQLLDIFQQERNLLKSPNITYLDYLAIQTKNFPSKSRNVVNIIGAINEKYSALPEHEKLDYEEKWKREFQPVVDDIRDLTQKLISIQTADLTPETMAKIEKLSIRQQKLEKEYPAPKLLPTFFESPD